MNTNTSSTDDPVGRPGRLAALTAAVNNLTDLDGLPDTLQAEQVLELRQLVDRLDGQWLKDLATVDARGAAGADQGQEFGSTAAWLRHRLHLSDRAATSAVRTARALFRGPLTESAQAVCDGELSVAHAQVLASGTHSLPDHVTAEAEPVLVEAARRLDPTRLRRLLGHLLQVADPDGADRDRERRHARRGLWLAPTFEGMVAVDGLLEPEAGQSLLAALEPLARPADATDTRNGSQRNADALAELARRALEGGRLPQTGGVRPQLSVIVDLDSLLGRPGAVGGEVGWAGPLDPEACRRLACDGAVTRVLVTRQHAGQHHPGHDPSEQPAPTQDPSTDTPTPPVALGPNPIPGVEEQLRAATALLPPTLGGAPTQPLEVGRTTRVIHPWLHGGPTDLANLALLCRAHHRAVHEGGWQLVRGPDGQLTATPPHRRHPSARRHPSVA